MPMLRHSVATVAFATAGISKVGMSKRTGRRNAMSRMSDVGDAVGVDSDLASVIVESEEDALVGGGELDGGSAAGCVTATEGLVSVVSGFDDIIEEMFYAT